MTIYLFLVYSFGLSAGMFTAAIAKGASDPSHSQRESISMGWILGLLQGIAALCGGCIGFVVKFFAPDFGIYIVSAVIILVAIEMVSSGFIKPDTNLAIHSRKDLIKLVAFPIALGLNGLVMGMILPWFYDGMLLGACYIAGATFIAILIGGSVGGRTGLLPGEWVERIGGGMILGSVVFTLFS
ncbi:manganese efflux pump [Pseudomonas viridiflava]|uniref:manganese efflux pump n=1 Tax=Pseudomonas viridiflava TaxID=33069 RepID=UPI0018E63B05|nr:manganese efflux pump [Pseudomonas viridiflava]MBI6727204.1 manganese efflux pump [Pseudomonas viridiflava]